MSLIGETWKELNTIEVENSIFPRVFIEIVKNLARIGQCMYQYGDGHGTGCQEITNGIMSLFIRPISMQQI